MTARQSPKSPRAKRRPDDQEKYVNLASFRLAIRQFLRYSDAVSGAAGITSQQYQVMLAISARDDASATLKQIAEEMLVLPHGAVQLVDRLERIGFVKRSPSAVDGRQVLVSLTGKGAKVFERLATDHLEELTRQEPLLAESLRRLRKVAK